MFFASKKKGKKIPLFFQNFFVIFYVSLSRVIHCECNAPNETPNNAARRRERMDYEEEKEEEETDEAFETFFAGTSSDAEKSEALRALKSISFRADKVESIRTHGRFSSLVKYCADERYGEDVSILVANVSGDQAKKGRRETYAFGGHEVVLETVDFQEGGLGCYVYDAEKRMCQWFLETNGKKNERDSFEGKRVLELGAGVGLLGLFLAKQREEVLDAIVVTEHVTSLLNVLEANGKLNALDETRFVVKRLLWEEACEMEKRADGSIADGSTTAKNIEDEDDRKWMRETLGKPTNEEERFDIVIGSELAYDERIIPPLLSVIDMFTKENGVVWISVVDRYEKKGVMIECFENEVSKYAHLIFERRVSDGKFHLYRIVKKNVTVVRSPHRTSR